MEDKWLKVNMHAFSINKMYEYRENKVRRTKAYMKWRKELLKAMKELPTLKELKVDPNKPMKIEMIYDTIRNVDVQNCNKAFLDVLAEHYNMPNDNNFTRIEEIRGENFVETKADGAIYFRIINCEGRIMNIYDELWLAIKQGKIQI